MIFAFNVSAIETWEALGQVLPTYLPIILSFYIGTLPSSLQYVCVSRKFISYKELQTYKLF